MTLLADVAFLAAIFTSLSADALQRVEDESPAYSTNAICRQNNCINPIFPGMQDISLLEESSYECQTSSRVSQHLKFCKNAVNYDVAVKSTNTSRLLQQMVDQQERAAVTAYFYHLAGMNLEAHKYKVPEESDNECITSIWKMVCNTYFPRAAAGCNAGEQTTYMRPCKNVCEKYVQACSVKCCDESVQCSQTASFAQIGTGYEDTEGPAATCTGAAPRAVAGLSPAVVLAGFIALLFPLMDVGGVAVAKAHREAPPAFRPRWRAHVPKMVLFPLAVSSLTLQGCLPMGYTASAWEQKPSYLMTYAYLPVMEKHPPQQVWQPPTSTAVLNSCGVEGVQASTQCSGRGVCRQWNTTAVDATPVSFCQCDRYWADPECRTKRKSHATAFFLSLFLGFLGADQFYLQEFYTGTLKLASFGGVGVWWIIDIVRIGSSPIYAGNGFRLAADLPHWLYVGSSVLVFALLGGGVFAYGASEVKKRQLTNKMLKKAEDQFFKTRSATVPIRVADRVGMPTRTTYSMPIPPYGTLVPPHVRVASYGNPFNSANLYLKQAELTEAARQQA